MRMAVEPLAFLILNQTEIIQEANQLRRVEIRRARCASDKKGSNRQRLTTNDSVIVTVLIDSGIRVNLQNGLNEGAKAGVTGTGAVTLVDANIVCATVVGFGALNN